MYSFCSGPRCLEFARIPRIKGAASNFKCTATFRSAIRSRSRRSKGDRSNPNGERRVELNGGGSVQKADPSKFPEVCCSVQAAKKLSVVYGENGNSIKGALFTRGLFSPAQLESILYFCLCRNPLRCTV